MVVRFKRNSDGSVFHADSVSTNAFVIIHRIVPLVTYAKMPQQFRISQNAI